MKKKLFIVLLAAVMCVAMLAGCGEKPAAPAEQVAGQPIKVGGTSAVIANLDPAVDWQGWYPVRYGVGETLFKLDEKLAPAPWLATGYERQDELTWKITLEEKATFSNGEKMTPEKVIESLQRVGGMNDRAKIFAESEYKAEGNAIIIKTPQPYATLVNDMCDPYAVIVDVKGTTDFAGAPVCTGPFVITSFEPEASVVLEKNKSYWGGDVKTEKIEYVKVADADTLALSLQTGEVDIALDLTPAAAESLMGKEGINVTKTVQPRVYQVYFNLGKMTDKAVREAIMMGIDKKAICEDQLKGAVTATVGAFPADSLYNGSGLKAKEYNEAAAKEMLKNAGYADTNGDGIVEKDGAPLTIKLSLYKRLAMESIGTEMQAALKKIGIDAQIEVFEKSTYFKEDNFDIGLYSIVTLPSGDPHAFLNGWMSKDGVANYGHFANDAVDAKLAAFSKSQDQAEQIAIINELQQIAIDEAACDYIGFNNMMTAASDKIEGYVTSPNDYYQVTKDLIKK